MARPKKKINPLCGERLKIILKEQNFTQKALYEAIYLSQQTISQIIRGKVSLTEDRARDIIDLFPEYNIEWLLGYSDCKTLVEYERIEEAYEVIETNKQGNFLSGIRSIANKCGFVIEFNDSSVAVTPKGKFDFKVRPFSHEELKTLEIDIDAFEEFLEDVEDFFCGRLNKLYKRGH